VVVNKLSRQTGQAMVETVVVLFAALLLLLGIIQFGLIYNAKTTLDYATFEAARAGALNYGDKTAIEYALARGLTPLFTSVDLADSDRDKVKTVQKSRDKLFRQIQSGRHACIERLNPDTNAFNAYAVTDPTGHFGTQRLIPNSHLHYRSALASGGSNVSIQDANLLKLRVTYCYPMQVPLISNTIAKLMGVRRDPDPVPGWQAPNLGAFQTGCYRRGRFPIVAQAVVRMQTPIKNDVFPASCE